MDAAMDGCNEGDVRELTPQVRSLPCRTDESVRVDGRDQGEFSATRESGRSAHEQIPAQGQT